MLKTAGRNQPLIWEIPRREKLLQLLETSSGISSALAFNSNGSLIAAGGRRGAKDSLTTIWRLEPDRGIKSLRGLASPVRQVFFASNSERVAAVTDDSHLGVWDVRDGHLRFVFEALATGIADNAGGCFDLTADRFAFAGREEVRLYDLRSGDTLRRWKLNPGYANRMAYDSSGHLLLLRAEGKSETTPGLWKLYALGDSEEPNLVLFQTNADWSVEDLAIGPRGDKFLVWSDPPKGTLRTIYAHDIKTGKKLWEDVMHWNDNPRASFDPSGGWFMYTGDFANARLSIMAVSNFTAVGKAPKYTISMSPSGLEFAGGAYVCLRPGSNPAVLPLHQVAGGSASQYSIFSPNGQYLA